MPRSSSGVLGFSPADLGWGAEDGGAAVLLEDTGLGGSMDLGELLRDDGDFLGRCDGVGFGAPGLRCCTESIVAPTTQGSCGSAITGVPGVMSYLVRGGLGDLGLGRGTGKWPCTQELEGGRVKLLQQLSARAFGAEAIAAEALLWGSALGKDQLQEQQQQHLPCSGRPKGGETGADCWVSRAGGGACDCDDAGAGSHSSIAVCGGFHSSKAATSNICNPGPDSLMLHKQEEQQQMHQFEQQVLLAGSSSSSHWNSSSHASAIEQTCVAFRGVAGGSGYLAASQSRLRNGSCLHEAVLAGNTVMGSVDAAGSAAGNTAGTPDGLAWGNSANHHQQQQQSGMLPSTWHGGVGAGPQNSALPNAEVLPKPCRSKNQQQMQQRSQQLEQQTFAGRAIPGLRISVTPSVGPASASPALQCVSPFQKVAMESPFGSCHGRFDFGQGAFQGVSSLPAPAGATAAPSPPVKKHMQAPPEPPRPFGLDLSARQYSSTSGSEQYGFSLSGTDWTGSCQVSRTATQQPQPLKVAGGLGLGGWDDSCAAAVATTAGGYAETEDRAYAGFSGAAEGAMGVTPPAAGKSTRGHIGRAAAGAFFAGYMNEVSSATASYAGGPGVSNGYCGVYTTPVDHLQQGAWGPVAAAAGTRRVLGAAPVNGRAGNLPLAESSGGSGSRVALGSAILLLTRPTKSVMDGEDVPAEDTFENKDIDRMLEYRHL
jgi:hypothetical protein